jgi:predicted DCC family thiol-disulfide oxidoreductase YuxK
MAPLRQASDQIKHLLLATAPGFLGVDVRDAQRNRHEENIPNSYDQLSMTHPSGHSIILYDGVCGLCNRFVQFVLKRDKQDRFRFAAIQGRFATEQLLRYKKDASALNTVFVLDNSGSPTERLLEKGDAALFVLKELGGVGAFAQILRALPQPLLDFGYDLIAANRYRVFGKYDSCPVPTAEQKNKFIEDV